MIKRFFILLALAGLCACEDNTSIDQINLFSGRWAISFYDVGNNEIKQGIITVKDNGNICSKIASGTDSLFVTGEINNTGTVYCDFSDTCRAYTRQDIRGSFREVLGILTGNGIWSDTIESGTWSARKY